MNQRDDSESGPSMTSVVLVLAATLVIIVASPFGHTSKSFAPPPSPVPQWNTGHWYHGEHQGRTDWWWIVNDRWFEYPSGAQEFPGADAPPAAAPIQSPSLDSLKDRNACDDLLLYTPEASPCSGDCQASEIATR